jgi:hypothetical protein
LIFFFLFSHLFLISPFVEQKHDIKNPFIFNKKIDDLPTEVKKLKKIYKDIKYENGYIIFSNKSKIIFNDGKSKTTQELLDNPDIKDMFHWKYITNSSTPNKDEDPGRIRNELFFKSLYGKSRDEVSKNLTSFTWCPKLVNKTIQFNKKNGALESLKKVSDELDQHPEWKKYISNIGGTFNWRNISGTTRLSAHSFGITIDINTSHSNYWQWDCGCKNENVKLNYKNKIPMEIVKIFEKNGFIWGGRWYHYDTMHFEYRPEMFDS